MSFSELFNLTRIRQAVSTWVIRKIQRHGPKRVNVLGKVFEVSKDVFNPKFYFTSEFMARHIEAGPDDEVLDMGTGSGIQAIVAGQNARRVVAVDINSKAVEVARRNVSLNRMEDRVIVLEGDLFKSLRQSERFDIIIFTPPYMEGVLRTNLDHALFDPDKALIKRFFNEAREYLKAGGYVQMLYSSIAEPSHALEIAEGLGWSFSLIARKKKLTETFLIYRLTPKEYKIP